MKKAIRLLTLLSWLIVIPSCKKESNIISTENKFGTIIGDGNPHTITEVIQTPDDQYIICGTVTRGKYGMFDGYVMKVDQEYNVVWYKNYGGSNQDFFESMALDASGNILLVGNSYSFGASRDTSNTKRSNLIYMVYIDNSGNKVWEKAYKAKENGSTKFVNQALKVLLLRDNTFCVGGSTSCFNSDNTSDGYVFGISNLGEIKWTSNFYGNILSQTNDDNETVDDMDLCENGNIMLAFQSPVNSASVDYFCSLIKIPDSSNSYKQNFSIWKSNPLPNLASRAYGTIKMQMEILPGDRIALGKVESIASNPSGKINQLLIANPMGSITSRTSFKYPFVNLNLTRFGQKLLVSGFYYDAIFRKFPCFAITDLDGNVILDFFGDSDFVNPNTLEFNTTVINRKNEIVTFGIISDKSRSYICILRFNQDGKLIKSEQ